MKEIKGHYGKCQIIDCMDGLKNLPDNSFDLCISDPPYNIAYQSNYYKDGNPNPLIQNDDHFFVEWIPEIHRVLKEDAGVLIFTSHKVFDIWKAEIEKYFIYKNAIVWTKNNWSAGDLTKNFGDQYEIMIYAIKGNYKIKGKRISNVVYADRIPPNIYNHSTPKPVDCIIPYIQSLEPKNIIDPFAGTNFVGQACEQLGVEWLTFELDEFYIPSITTRIQKGIEARKGMKEQKTLFGSSVDKQKEKEQRKQKKFGSRSKKLIETETSSQRSLF